ncbi:unnamed protein product [Symbiodinium microadriaticum]|nr:unnamed protein product [Symbiodinium microadriaticum]
MRDAFKRNGPSLQTACLPDLSVCWRSRTLWACQRKAETGEYTGVTGQEVEAELRELSLVLTVQLEVLPIFSGSEEYTDRAILKIRHHREDASRNGHGSGSGLGTSDFPLDEVLRAILMACETFHNKIVMISLSCLQRLIHREALKEETVAIVVNLMKEQVGAQQAPSFNGPLLVEVLLYSLHNSSNASSFVFGVAQGMPFCEDALMHQMELPTAGEFQNIRTSLRSPAYHGDRESGSPGGACFVDMTPSLGRMSADQWRWPSWQAFCEDRGLSGIVLYGGLLYLRPPGPGSQLLAAARVQPGADLLVRPAQAATDEPEDASALRIAVLATQDEFDETSLFAARSDLGMVSTTGNGRRYAAQALLRDIMCTEGVLLTALLIYDWKNDSTESSGNWALPEEGPQRCTVALRGGKQVTAWRGSMTQLMGACAGDLVVDVAVSIQARRSCLEILRSISSKKCVVMGHDYNLPFGPWGMEAEPTSLAVHRELLQNPNLVMFCTSQHLCNFVERFSEGGVQTCLCYCADYGYFDSIHGFSPPALCDKGQYVTFISPCPAKGLAVVLRLALMFANIQFLCVSTGWTKTLHEVQLRAHPNITIVAGTDNIEEIYRQTAVLLMPSLWQESFGLVAVEAQLRGIPVVSTAACGLREANFLEELQVQNVRLVHDSRTREMLRGITMEDAELTLNPLRPGHDSTKGSRWYVHVAHTIVATEAEAAGFAKLVQSMTFQDDNTSEALPESGGQLSKPLTVSGIHRQRRLGAKVVPRCTNTKNRPAYVLHDAVNAVIADGSVMRRAPVGKLPNVAPNQAPDGLRGPLRMYYIFVQDLCVMADYDVSSMSDAQVPSQQHCREELAWRSKVLNGKGDDAAGNVLVV